MATEEIWILGASWAEPGSPMVAAAQARTSKPVKAMGVRGSRIAGWLSEIDYGTPSAVVIAEMGGNGAATADQVRTADREVKARTGKVPTWLLPPSWPVAGATKERREATKRAILEAGVRVASLPALTAFEVSSDSVHPTVAGYRKLGAAIPLTASFGLSIKSVAFCAALITTGVWLWRG